MKDKDKRSDIRIPLLSETVAISSDFYFDRLDVADICSGGIFVKIKEPNQFLKAKTKVKIIFTLPGDLGDLDLTGEVCRVNWMLSKKKNITVLGMAIKFDPMDAGRKKIMDAYRIYLRNKQIITVSKRIIEEFFGDQGPKKLL
jgi:hypothetical protein